ncbi:MAG: AraC family transcriptional regulator [Burkholderiaceae bacterium]|nr:AraC family transcriptional regulator [Burkholderiaceae bacterium]
MSSLTANMSAIQLQRPLSLPATTVHPTYARALCMLMRQHGVAAEPALALAGLSEAVLASDDQPVTLQAVTQLALQALQVTGKPWLGLALGRVVHASAHGLVGHAALTSRDLRELLQTVARYGGLRTDAFRFSWTEDGAGGALKVQNTCDLGPARQFVVDAVFSTLLVLLENGTGQRPNGLTAVLPFVPPPWRAAYCEHTGLDEAHLRFGGDALSLHLPTAILPTTCITADARAHQAACRSCDEMLGRSITSATVAGRVRKVLEQAAPGGFPTLEDVASALHRSPRTLMRQLQREGVRYMRLLDEVRKARALSDLCEGRDTVETIAARLGFVDTSNFSRTCRRWFGQTPGAIRAGSAPLPVLAATGDDGAGPDEQPVARVRR